ncbi:hypothetical protein GCM10027598_66900 [Amycolatopsis oliviviridis]|uniref:Uncharacterized protein n=1 Tax=Amycolatopsis oliviviridis TaxID=1471590 RepID=A0ABQ3M9N3_9PSEU|nr:hypothetical protein GCM10017790_63850 [Amycolatopsis oliviviridis]
MAPVTGRFRSGGRAGKIGGQEPVEQAGARPGPVEQGLTTDDRHAVHTPLPSGNLLSAPRKPHPSREYRAAYNVRHDLQRTSAISCPQHRIAGVRVLLGRLGEGNHDLWLRAGRGRLVPRDGAPFRHYADNR